MSSFVNFCLGVLVANPLFAQSDRGTIVGAVTDSTGAVIPGAKVVVSHTQTGVNLTLLSSDTGNYTAPSLPVGAYNVRVDKDGFRPFSLTGIELNASMTVRADAMLEVGTSNQLIEVSATSLALATENAKVSVTVTNKLVDELPLVVGGALPVH